jgi:hypothetical protein
MLLSRDLINIILTVLTIFNWIHQMANLEEKLIRDTFTMLPSDAELIIALKRKCLSLGIETNKSELVRAGLGELNKLSEDKLNKILAVIPKFKTGRKKKVNNDAQNG